MLFIWGIGAPILALAVMLKYKKSLNEWNVQKYLLVLYQGLKLERFYWELINTARKTLLLWLPTLMSTLSLNYKVASAIILMIGVLRIQKKLEPYKTEANNKLEFNEIITGTFTIYATMIYQDEDNNQPMIDFIVFWLGKSVSYSNIFI